MVSTGTPPAARTTAQPKPSLRLYIDEVGNDDMSPKAHVQNERYLSLTGVIMTIEQNDTVLRDRLDGLVREFVVDDPDHDVIIHRKEILHAEGQWSVLRRPETRAAFDEKLMRLLEDVQYKRVQ